MCFKESDIEKKITNLMLAFLNYLADGLMKSTASTNELLECQRKFYWIS